MKAEITLPFPPSINNYLASVSGKYGGYRRILTREAKSYRSEVIALLYGRNIAFGARRLKMLIEVYAPDKRRHDLDNLLKSLQDSLEHAGVYNNDNQIDDLQIVRREVRKGGEIHVTINALD